LLVVLSEDSFHDATSINGRELHAVTETARLFGCRVVALPPQDFVAHDAEVALAYLPPFEPPVAAVWTGYIPSSSWYTAVFEAARAKGVRLVNSPAQHRTAMEFDRFYPLLEGLTPESRVITAIDQCAGVAGELSFPLFVKGAVKSNKEQGWNACVACNEAELAAIAKALFERDSRSRGKVIIRRLVDLRHVARDPQGFPLGREYRVFVYGDQVLTCGFYWDEFPDTQELTPTERAAITRLAIEGNRRLQVTFTAVDVAQLTSGEWIIIEVNDAQFAGLSQAPVLELWSKLAELHAGS
jgi:hypothetical protein